MRRLRRFIALSLVTLGSFGCEPEYASLDMEVISTPPLPVSLTPRTIEIPAGLAVVVRVSPHSSTDEDYDSSYSVALEPRDRDVLLVRAGERRREFVFVGVAPGETCLEVFIDGNVEDCVDVLVTAQ